MTELVDYKGASWELNKEQQEFFEEMEKELGMPITIVNGKGQRKQRSSDVEGIVIFDYATNSESPTPRRCDAISRRNKTTVPLKNHFLLKHEEREYIFDFNGFPLAEIKLYTLWGLTPLENFQTKDLMKEFWADALRQCCKEDFFRAKEEEKKKKIRNAFIESMKSSNEVEIRELEKTISQNSDRLAQLNTDLVAVSSEIFKAEKRKQVAEEIAGGDQEAYETEIESLMRHTQVREIGYKSDTGMLEIYTNLLYIYSPDRSERAPLGEFLIKVNTKSNNAITLHNLTGQKSGKMHPHVESNGHACWGAIGTQIAKLAATCKIEGLADFCIRYLETYNVQDSNATYARYWFLPDKIEKKRSDFDDVWMNESDYKQSKEQKKSNTKEEVKEAKGKSEIKVEKVSDKTLKEIKN